MGTRLQDEGNRILNAVNEGQVIAVITLYERDMLSTCEKFSVGKERTKRQEIFQILHKHLGMSYPEAIYWLDWFHIV